MQTAVVRGEAKVNVNAKLQQDFRGSASERSEMPRIPRTHTADSNPKCSRILGSCGEESKVGARASVDDLAFFFFTWTK